MNFQAGTGASTGRMKGVGCTVLLHTSTWWLFVSHLRYEFHTIAHRFTARTRCWVGTNLKFNMLTTGLQKRRAAVHKDTSEQQGSKAGLTCRAVRQQWRGHGKNLPPVGAAHLVILV